MDKHHEGKFDARLVSVVMPTFNTSEYLDDAIESVLKQHLPAGFRVELLLIDDGSTSQLMLDRLQGIESQKRPGIRVFRLGKNGGISAARNFGVRRACGRYLAFLDSDDFWESDHLLTHLDVMLEHGVGMTGTDYNSVRSDGTVHAPSHFANHPRKGHALRHAFATGKPVVYTAAAPMFIDCCPTHTLVVTVDRERFSAHEVRFDERLRLFEDIHLWIKLVAQSNFGFIPKTTAAYRYNPDSISRSIGTSQRDIWHVRALEYLLTDDVGRQWGSQLRARLCETLTDLAYEQRKEGLRGAALRSAIDALGHRPASTRAMKEVTRSLAAVTLRF